jgi:hypothetical protein
MKPREKAKELYDKFCDYAEKKVWDSKNYNAIECALIAVDEIMKANPIVPLQFMLESEAMDEALFYWKEVKSEIEKL